MRLAAAVRVNLKLLLRVIDPKSMEKQISHLRDNDFEEFKTSSNYHKTTRWFVHCAEFDVTAARALWTRENTQPLI